ncbi:MAG TPA: glucokinase [Hanamia sp.]|nr:glucokinase [Hanamia sp.]
MLLSLSKSMENNKVAGKATIVLAGDIGATKTNLTFFKIEGGHLALLHEAQFKSNDYKNIVELTNAFTKDILLLPDSICFGVAGPVLNGHAKLSNLDWEIDSDELSDHFKIKNVHLINDLEATAYGLAMLNETDVAIIHKGDDAGYGNAAVIAPGTGLGEAGLFWDGNYYHPFATEGGHSDFAPRNEFDFELFTFLQKKFDHVSWEHLVCGPGIVNIYQFLREEKKREEPGWLKEEIMKEDAAAVISRRVLQSEICKETMQLFIRFLAYESANLVLKLKATGGLFIGGGIAPQIVSLLENNAFHASFCQSGRLNYLLEKVPVKIILNAKTALLGAAFYGAKN